MKLGIIGLDSSHAVEFSRILNDASQPFHITGHTVVAAYPGEPSLDFDMSHQRLEPFTKQVWETYGVALYDSIEEVMEQVDAVFLEQVDGRKRLEQFSCIAPYAKPVFVDKPFALSSADCAQMLQLAQKYAFPLLSSSSLRFADGWARAIAACKEAVLGADVYGPMPFTPTQPGYFWYGVHMVDMLYAAFGAGCRWVQAQRTPEQDILTAAWQDGRLATIRGNRFGNPHFGGTLFTQNAQQFVDVSNDKRGYYEALVEAIVRMFDTGHSPVAPEETAEVVRFLEAANESAETGKQVYL